MAPPTARFQLAFTADTLDPDPTWTDMDDLLPVSGYQIDRGRGFELDRVDVGRAVVTLNDLEGVLDPTNTGGAFFGDIQPLIQARLALWNPVLEDWYTRFRGFVEAYEYEFDPSQLVNRVTIRLVDIFEIVTAVQMFPGNFGDPPPARLQGQVVFMEDTVSVAVGGETDARHGMQRRIVDIIGDDTNSTFALGSCGIPEEFYLVTSGNVAIKETTYSPGESAMAAVQDAADAEFPGVANVFGDRLGKLTCLGRYARFDPEGTAAETGWDFNDWQVGDGAAVLSSPSDTAQIRGFATSRDLSKIINTALASPKDDDTDINYETQIDLDATSRGKYGIRGWSAQDLLTKEGVTDGDWGANGDWLQTKRFAEYYTLNFAQPANRITTLTFRSTPLSATGAAPTWLLMSEIDISDRVNVTLDSPGGGGFTGESFYVEGVHETYAPANPDMDDITLTLDVSPSDYFEQNPFSVPS